MRCINDKYQNKGLKIEYCIKYYSVVSTFLARLYLEVALDYCLFEGWSCFIYGGTQKKENCAYILSGTSPSLELQR